MFCLLDTDYFSPLLYGQCVLNYAHSACLPSKHYCLPNCGFSVLDWKYFVYCKDERLLKTFKLKYKLKLQCSGNRNVQYKPEVINVSMDMS